MRLNIIIIAILVIVMAGATMAHAWSDQQWTVKHTESEMGEGVTLAAVRDHDPEARAIMSVSKPSDTVLLVVQMYGHKPSFTEDTLEFKVDDNEIITRPARQLNNPDALATVPNTRLLNQLMAGGNVKVRFDTLGSGLVVVDFKLDGSMNAIGQVIGEEL